MQILLEAISQKSNGFCYIQSCRHNRHYQSNRFGGLCEDFTNAASTQLLLWLTVNFSHLLTPLIKMLIGLPRLS